MPTFSLIPIAEANLPKLRELALATWEPTYDNILSREQLLYMQEEIYTLPALRRQIASGQRFYFITTAGSVVGFLSITLSNAAEGLYKLNKLYMLPQEQGKGTGRIALEAAFKLVRNMGGKVLELNVNRHNPAKRFYERCGLQVVREEDIPIGPYWMNDFVMQKVLV